MRKRVLIAMAVVVVLLGLRPIYHESISPQEVETPSITRMPTQALSQSGKVTQIDINGSYVCEYASRSAYIKNKQILLRNKTSNGSNFLIRDNCMYVWNEGRYTGQKQCDINKYLSMYETMSKTGLMSNENLISAVGMMNNKKKDANTAAEMKNFMNTCKQSNSIKAEVFTIPREVLFKNAKLF